MQTVEETRRHVITAAFTDEEYDLLEAFAAEQGIEDLKDTVPAMLHELVRLHDAWWDAQFKNIPPALNEMARKALDDYHAGMTENL
ncbi:MAG: hypothetical protein ABI700_23730 [Chloroflexota bacterium]